MNIFLAVTDYDHKVSSEFSDSILKACVCLVKEGHMVTPFYSHDLYIDRSRNLCVEAFLSTNCTDMVFLDSDLSFPPESLSSLLKFNKDVIGGAYPYKKDKEEYPVILDFSRGNNCKEESTGLVHVTSLPTGFMRINRQAFVKLMSVTPKDERGIYQFFRTGRVVPNDLNWYGEDSYFCKECREVGIELFVNPNITFSHYGMKEYTGNYHEYLMSRSLDKMDHIDSGDAGIKGWTTPNELAFLGIMASQCSSVLEVGSWKGRSTKALLDNCKGTVHSVDSWHGSPQDITSTITELSDVYKVFLGNVGSYSNLIVHKGKSVDEAELFLGKVDMVFIDAGHTYEECKEDIEAWLPKANRFICGHDYTSAFDGVIKAVKEKFSIATIIDSIWFVDLTKENIKPEGTGTELVDGTLLSVAEPPGQLSAVPECLSESAK